jgi:hypothetical protein
VTEKSSLRFGIKKWHHNEKKNIIYMELRYIEDETSNRLISARELATIARRYDFEPLADYDENLKWTNTNAFFGDKTMDTG